MKSLLGPDVCFRPEADTTQRSYSPSGFQERLDEARHVRVPEFARQLLGAVGEYAKTHHLAVYPPSTGRTTPVT